MELVPELVLGKADGAAPFLFARIAAIDVDSARRIYVLDAESREVRVFSPTGEHIRSMGRRGGGPGEFNLPHAMRVTPDGRVFVRDNRMTVFNSQGILDRIWQISSGFSSNSPFYITSDGRILNRTFADSLVWYKLDGTAIATFRLPLRGAPPPVLIVASPGSIGGTRYSIPFTPSTVWTLRPSGDLIVGRSDRYEFDVFTGSRVMRVARTAPAVPISQAEANQVRESMTRNLRLNDPDYRWNGPDIARAKPYYESLLSGRDGTVWVVRSTASREERNPDYNPERPNQGFPTQWTASRVADVFDSQGQYLGAVRMPQRMPGFPEPVVSLSAVWAVMANEDGVPQIIRFSLRAPPG
jgi:hypothetical protein